MTRHPFTDGWSFPPSGRADLPAPLERVNLRELCARPNRFEHHLLVVARIGDAQLEVPTASEPLAFAHVNVSDEYVVVLPTGHPMLDGFPYRVFVSDAANGEDVLRIQHHVLELVLHPFGYAHFPGRLRAPYDMPPIPPGMRRAGLTLVFCASAPTPPPEDRALWVSTGLESAAKRYVERDVPTLVAALARESERRVAEIADVSWDLVVEPQSLAPPRGGYVVVLDAEPGCLHLATDLVYVPEGARLDARGIRRALVMQSQARVADPPPPSWHTLPEAPFAVFEQGPRRELPCSLGALEFGARDERTVRVSLEGEERAVPRYWLARLLFRWALHGYRLGYAETYEGFFVDDTGGVLRAGLRGVGHVTGSPAQFAEFVERAYRACAPDGYTEYIG